MASSSSSSPPATRMEGWLYLMRRDRLGLHSSRKRFFVVDDNVLRCYKSVPASDAEDPVRSAIIDSCIRVAENGRENIYRNVFYTFTLYSTANHYNQLKLGAKSPEDASQWIHYLMETAMKCPRRDDHVVACSRRRWQLFRRNHCCNNHMHSSDWISSASADPMTSDVVAPSSWTIFTCKNGLRLFTERKDENSRAMFWGDHPAIMAVGVVDATSEAVFQTLMSLGQSRSEWDFCLLEGRIIERLDGHTDIIHEKLRTDWLPWGIGKRDLLLQRYWRREDDGTYVILCHSVFHHRCPHQKGYVRACLKSGGYVISPVNQGKQSVVKHMLAMEWKFWKSYMFASSAKYITVRMLARVAALREFYRAKNGTYTYSDFSYGELARDARLPKSSKEDLKHEVQAENTSNSADDPSEGTRSLRRLSSAQSILQLSDAADEFYDVPDEPDFDPKEVSLVANDNMETTDQRHAKLSTAAVIVKKLHDLATQKRGYVDLQDAASEDDLPCYYGATLPRDSNYTRPSSWAMADASTFLVRGESYLLDSQKIKANGTAMQMVAADWITSDKREDNIAGRPGSIVQKYAVNGGNEFFFIVNIQVPGSTTYSLALYFVMDTPLENVPLFEAFVKGDDTFRDSRFKLIPYISKGSWIVKQSVGKKACLVGQALKIHYFSGINYLEADIDVGSSTVAKGVVNLVTSYLTNLVIELAFLVQGNTQEELPEFLLGTCRLNHLDSSKAVPVSDIS